MDRVSQTCSCSRVLGTKQLYFSLFIVVMTKDSWVSKWCCWKFDMKLGRKSLRIFQNTHHNVIILFARPIELEEHSVIKGFGVKRLAQCPQADEDADEDHPASILQHPEHPVPHFPRKRQTPSLKDNHFCFVLIVDVFSLRFTFSWLNSSRFDGGVAL